VYDALRRKFQCATVQLDFQLPIRFDLTYATESGNERPVIVHRAVLGSIERMYAILTEHFAGKWPLWLSPRQIMVVPISEASYEYAQQVRTVCCCCSSERVLLRLVRLHLPALALV
jgi:threonyl-tRNA synthetase